VAKTPSKVLLLGPCNVYVDSVDQGFVADAVATVSFQRTDAMVAEAGDTPIKSWVLANGLSVQFTVKETDLDRWNKLLGGSAVITDGTDKALGIGQSAGTPITPVELMLEPQTQNAVANSLGTLTIWKAVPDGDFAVSWNAEQSQPQVTMRALFDPDRNEGEKLGRFGDADVSADATAPTVSSRTPADGATGVVVSADITRTFNEAMLSDTINARTMLVFEATETGVQTPIAGAVSYDSATRVATFNPTASLGAATEYEVVLTTGIKNSSGLAFAGEKTSFTTA
jgi:hypothetical protein